jgi:hypothetical protein
MTSKPLIKHIEESPLKEYTIPQVAQLLGKERNMIYVYINKGWAAHDGDFIKLKKTGTRVLSPDLIDFLTRINETQDRKYYRAVL